MKRLGSTSPNSRAWSDSSKQLLSSSSSSNRTERNETVGGRHPLAAEPLEKRHEPTERAAERLPRFELGPPRPLPRVQGPGPIGQGHYEAWISSNVSGSRF
jgi:hypothetical protein